MAIDWISRLADKTNEEEKKKNLVRSYPAPLYESEEDPYNPSPKQEEPKMTENTYDVADPEGVPRDPAANPLKEAVMSKQDFDKTISPDAMTNMVTRPDLNPPKDYRPNVPASEVQDYKILPQKRGSEGAYNNASIPKPTPLQEAARKRIVATEQKVNGQDSGNWNTPKFDLIAPHLSDSLKPVREQDLTNDPQTKVEGNLGTEEIFPKEADPVSNPLQSAVLKKQLALQEQLDRQDQPYDDSLTPRTEEKPPLTLAEKVLGGAYGLTELLRTDEGDQFRLNYAQNDTDAANNAQRLYSSIPGVNIKDRDYTSPVTQQIGLRNQQANTQRQKAQDMFNNTATLARLSAEKDFQEKQLSADWEFKETDEGVYTHNKRTDELKFKPYTDEQKAARLKRKAATSPKALQPFSNGFTVGYKDTSKQLALNRSAPVELEKAKSAAGTVVEAYKAIIKEPTIVAVSKMPAKTVKDKVNAQQQVSNFFDTHQLELIPFITAQATASNSGVLNQGEFDRYTENLLGVSFSRLLSISQNMVKKGSVDESWLMGLAKKGLNALTQGLDYQADMASAMGAYSRLLRIASNDPSAFEPNDFINRLKNIAVTSANDYKRKAESYAYADEELEGVNANPSLYVGRVNPYFTNMFGPNGEYSVPSITELTEVPPPPPGDFVPAYTVDPATSAQVVPPVVPLDTRSKTLSKTERIKAEAERIKAEKLKKKGQEGAAAKGTSTNSITNVELDAFGNPKAQTRKAPGK